MDDMKGKEIILCKNL